MCSMEFRLAEYLENESEVLEPGMLEGATLHNLSVSSTQILPSHSTYTELSKEPKKLVTDCHTLPRFASFLCLNGCLRFVQARHTLG